MSQRIGNGIILGDEQFEVPGFPGRLSLVKSHQGGSSQGPDSFSTDKTPNQFSLIFLLKLLVLPYKLLALFSSESVNGKRLIMSRTVFVLDNCSHRNSSRVGKNSFIFVLYD